MQIPHQERERSFTIIEMIVAVAIFIVVVTIAAGALLSVIQANKKAQSIKSVVNNLHFALEGMSREIRVGSNYTGGGTEMSFTDSDGQPVTYMLEEGAVKQLLPGNNCIEITAPEVTVSDLDFTITGAAAGDGLQPRVRINVRGSVGGADPETKTDFDVQTVISQRLIDS